MAASESKAAPFVWGDNGEVLTEDEIKRRRRVADALLAKGMDFSPVGHWTQGAARVAHALAGAIQRGQADKAEKANEEADKAFRQQMLDAVRGGSSIPATAASDAAETASAPSFAGGGSSRTMILPEGTNDGGETFAQIGPRLQADLVKDFSLPTQAAAGVVGSLAHESGGFGNLQEDKPAVPGSRGGYGYAQWTGPRRRAFEEWAAANNLDPTSYEANYGFLKHELQNTPEGNVLASLRTLNDPNAAAQVFTNKFLRPGIPAMDSRLKWTQRALAFGSPADLPAPGASQASLAGQGQGFVIPGGPAVADTEADVQRLEQGMIPAGANTGDVFSPVPMAEPQGFSATPREAVAKAMQTASLPQTAPLPPARAADLPAPDAQPAMAQAPMAAAPAGPSQEDIYRVISDPNLPATTVMELHGPNREAVLGNLLQSNPETARAESAPVQMVAQALFGPPANDNRANVPTAGVDTASFQGGATAALPVTTGSTGTARNGNLDALLIEGATNPRLSEGTRRLATILYQQQQASQKVDTVDLGNAIGVMDSRGNIVRRIPKEIATKPEYREINGRLVAIDGGQARDITPEGLPQGYRTLSDPAERARFGIPADDTTPYQIGPDGKLHAPPAGTKVILPAAEKAEDEERGKGLAKRFNDMAADGPQAAQDLAAAQRLDILMRNVDPGTRTAALEAIRKVTGFDLDPNASNVQAAGALIDYLVPRMRVPGSGASSDRDMQSFKNSLVSLMGTPEGNAIVMQTIGGMAQMRVQMSRIAEDYQVGDIDAKTANQRIRELGDPFAQFKQWQSAQEQARKGAGAAKTGPQTTPALPPGYTPQSALDEARAAIAAGKDRNAVIQRLRAMGINPEGL